jgi:UDP-N-acetylmuramoyl-tripeptide--D-alanyl-D-alanine ligase
MFSAPNQTAFALIQKAFAASSGVTTDTRTASADKLFFALKGENFDGNLYAKEALAKGCIAVVMDDPTLSQHLENAILVENALNALQALAQWHRRKWDCPVIGLTGSNGKTTTKELLKMVCQNRFPGIQATHGNLNNEIGVPLTLLSISNNPDFVIVEMGANAQGEIELLAQIAEPTHGIITNIGRAHLEGFGGLDGVIKGKE